MVSVVIYGIIAIALAAAAGYALLVFSSTTQQRTQLQENSVRLDQATNALRASLLSLNGNGVLFAPMGNTSGAYTQLPASLGAVGSSPWGKPFLYCPVSQTGSVNPLPPQSTLNVTSPDSSTYGVGVYGDNTTLNTPYVIISTGLPNGINPAVTPAATGYVAYIVSSLGSNQGMPSCDQITVSANGVTVMNGSVRGVTAGFPFNQRVIASTDRMELYVGTAATGDSTGRDPSNVTTLDNAMYLWASLQPRLTDIYLTNGASYTLNQDIGLAGHTGRPTYFQGFAETPNLVFDGYGATPTLTIGVTQTPVTPVSFINLTIINNGSPSSIYSYAPLKFINSNYSSAGTLATSLVQVFNSNFTAWDSNFTLNDDIQLYNGSSGFFYTDGTSSISVNGRVLADDSRISFWNANAGTGQFNIVSIGNGYDALQMVNSSAELTYNSVLNVQSSGTGTSPIGEFNGSRLMVESSAIINATQNSSSAGSPGIYLQGSKLTNNYGTINISSTTPGTPPGIFIDTDSTFDMFGGLVQTSGSIFTGLTTQIGGKFQISTGTIKAGGSANCFGFNDINPSGTILVPPNGGYTAATANYYLPYFTGSEVLPSATQYSAGLGDVTGTVAGATADIPWANLAPAIQTYVNNMLSGSVAGSYIGNQYGKNLVLYNFTCTH